MMQHETCVGRAWLQRLELQYDELHSSFGFDDNLRLYNTGGDNVEGVLHGASGEVGDVLVVDHGDGTYGLEFHCTSQGVWTLRLRFNGRLSSHTHELIVSYGPLVAVDLRVPPPKGPFRCGGYTDVAVEIARPEFGRVMSGVEAFSVRVISPSAMSMSVPLELEPGSTRAVATVCWPEVGEHSVSVTLDGALLPRCPMEVMVAPEDICLAACQIQGSGRGLHSFRLQINFSSTVHRVTQLDPCMRPGVAQVELYRERV